jgi:succinyl-diaminopimelate desuccinylase
MLSIDPVKLTQELIKFDTLNPPGNELAALNYIADILRSYDIPVFIHSFGHNRSNLIAKFKDIKNKRKANLLLTGHIDTVTLGNAEWTKDPFGGIIEKNLLYGRGASDMKSGVAAMVCAFIQESEQTRLDGSATLVITGGEETGCQGAEALVKDKLLPKPDLIVVGEPTSNRIMNGHKGALWLKVCCRGRSAHGATPHLGDNAIYKAAKAVTKLEHFSFNTARHPVLGEPTLNVGTIFGGSGVNSVPDFSEIQVDIRLVPNMDKEKIVDEISFTIGEEGSVETTLSLPAVWSDPESKFLRLFKNLHFTATGRVSDIEGANYFTDASIFAPAFGGADTIICGPGEPSMAHKIDEYCIIDKVTESVEIYKNLIRKI